MVLGYDEQRPLVVNYQDFLTKLKKGLEGIGDTDISLMIYGSYVRGDYVPGRSDIDGVLIFPDNVVIDKNKLNLVSKVVAYAQKENNIPFQVTTTDLRTMQDGRFNTYEENFEPYFAEEGKIIFGKDYRKEFSYLIPKCSGQNALRFNLRKSRTGLLFFEYDKTENYGRMLERFNKTLDATSRASKQILSFIDGNLRKNRFSALEELSKTFPNLDVEPLKKIKKLYYNLEELDNLYRNPEELIKVWNNAVTFFESLIRDYLELDAGQD